jgi:thiamine pyrophosphokinase
MSSHHVVREKQEPALLVLSLDNFDDDLLGQLLEWSPTVITTPQTAEQLNAFGIKIDWVISNSDDDLQSDVKIIPQGDLSETESALNFLVIQAYPAVNIVADDIDLDDYIAYADKINLVILAKGNRICTIQSGFTKWKVSGEFIEVLSPTASLQFSGLENVGDNLYKTTHDGFFTLSFDEAFLFVAEDI